MEIYSRPQKTFVIVAAILGFLTLWIAGLVRAQGPVQNPPGVAPSPSASLGGAFVIGTSPPITGGANGQVIFDNNGLPGEYPVTGSGSVALSASPTFTGTALFGALTASNNILAGAANVVGFSGRSQISSPALSKIQFGPPDAAAPVSQTLQSQSVLAGQTNVSAPTAFVGGGKSTGSGCGDLTFVSTLGVAGATVQNVLSNTGLTVKGCNQNIVVANTLQHTLIYSAAGTPLPTCNGGAEGTRAAVSDALAPTFLTAYTSGGTVHASVYCDGTSWKTD